MSVPCDKVHGTDHAAAIERDQHARRIAQRDFSRPLVVEAGAGSGKTATLVARVLAWCLDEGWARARDAFGDRPGDLDAPQATDARIAAHVLRRVVAITFTEAAAAEMASRVAEALVTVRDGGVPTGFEPVDVGADAVTVRGERAGHLLTAVDQLQVRTIHGFCRRLLAASPFEAGLHPRFTVDADGSRTRALVEPLVADALVAAYGERDDSAALRLAMRGVGPPEIADATLALLARGLRPGDLDPDPFDHAARRAFATRLRASVGAVLRPLEGRLAGAARARNAHRLTDALRRVDLLLHDPDLDLDQLRAQTSAHLNERLRAHLASWSRGRFSRTEADHLGAAAQTLRTDAGHAHALLTHVAELDPEASLDARRVLVPLLTAARSAMRRAGVVGFADLLRDAVALLADTRRCARIRHGIDQLLVDEFQDTDHLQGELVRRLALEGPPASRPGLFLVGDPKQSIYGWRSADLAAYESIVDAALGAGGTLLRLTVSFRSVPAILDEVARVIAPVMHRSAGLQPAFVPLDPSPMRQHDAGFDTRPWAPVEHWLSWSRDPDAPSLPVQGGSLRASGVEAKALATDLERLHRHGTPWRDIGLLVRSTTDLEVYLGALRDAGIPFSVSRDRQYFRRREVIDAAAWVRTVLSPGDDLALVTTLRAPIVGVPDAALLPLWRAGLAEQLAVVDGPSHPSLSVLHTRVDYVADTLIDRGVSASIPGLDGLSGWRHSLHHLLDSVAHLRAAFERLPMDRFVDRLRALSMIDATEAARYLGNYRLANLERFFDQLRTALEVHEGDRHQVLRSLRHHVGQESEAEEAPPKDLGDEAVRVMTIHRAKGLQFKHVYLLQMHKESAGRDEAAVDLGRSTDTHGDDRPEDRLFGAPTLGFDQVLTRRRAVEDAELVRTLYVGMTRAEDRLVLAGLPPVPTDDTSGAVPARTHATLLAARPARPSLARLHGTWANGHDRQHTEGVAWVLPALVASVERTTARRPEHTPIPSVGALERQAADQRRCLAAARRHSDRSFGSAASSLGYLLGTDEGATREPDRVPTSTETRDEPPPDSERALALAVGTLVHAVFEEVPLDADDLGAALLDTATGLCQRPVAGLDPALHDEAFRRTLSLIERFVEGPLWTRYTALRPPVVARGQPRQRDPPPHRDQARQPVGAISRTVDLVVRDDEGLLIVDYKTDRVTEDRVAAHAARYRHQGRAYVRALQDACGLERPPRFELWYLVPGVVARPLDGSTRSTASES